MTETTDNKELVANLKITIEVERISLDEVVIRADATVEGEGSVLEGGGPQRVWLRSGDAVEMNIETYKCN